MKREKRLKKAKKRMDAVMFPEEESIHFNRSSFRYEGGFGGGGAEQGIGEPAMGERKSNMDQIMATEETLDDIQKLMKNIEEEEQNPDERAMRVVQ